MANVKFATQYRLNEVVFMDHKALFQIASQTSKAVEGWPKSGTTSSKLVMTDAIPY